MLQREAAQSPFAPFGVRIAVAILAGFLFIAVTATWIAPYDPAAQPDVRAQAMAPSLDHPLGTDRYSRDVLSRMIVGTQVSLGVAAASVFIALVIGTAIGAIAGFAGGAADRWLMRGVDAVLSLPRLLVLLLIAVAFPHMSVAGLALVLGLTGWPAMSRVVRAQVRETAVREYVLAARALGVRERSILWRHVLPAVIPQVLVFAALSVATVIPLEAGLSFLGLGVRSPTPSWGNILLEGADRGLDTWWLLLFPSLAIIGTVLSVNVVGERFHDVLDPRTESRA